MYGDYRARARAPSRAIARVSAAPMPRRGGSRDVAGPSLVAAANRNRAFALLLEVGEALVEIVLRVLIVGVLLELRLGHGAQESGHAHLALDVHRLGVGLELGACGERRWRGEIVAGQKGAKLAAVRLADERENRLARARAPLAALAIFACLSARALADFCALPPPISSAASDVLRDVKCPSAERRPTRPRSRVVRRRAASRGWRGIFARDDDRPSIQGLPVSNPSAPLGAVKACTGTHRVKIASRAHHFCLVTAATPRARLTPRLDRRRDAPPNLPSYRY